MISFTDAENRTTNYTYDSLFGLTEITHPDSTFEQYEYDDVGNVVSFTDANGNETVCTYDDAYRLIQIQYQDQSSVSFFYDVNSNRIRMDDDAPDTGDYVEYTYDSWNRLITESRHISLNTYTVSYQYDEGNRLTTLIYPDNMQILYSYDDLSRTSEIKRYIDGVNDEILMDNIQYDIRSLLTQFDYGNNLQTTFSYDSRNRLLSADLKDGDTSYLDLDYTYDVNSNITQLVNGWRDTNSDWHSDTEIYDYDGLDRLASASSTSWSHTYSYDKVGNRISKDGITYTINTVNEVTSLSDGTSFSYDPNGSRTQKTKGSDTWVYTYDDANRLTKVEKNAEALGEYVYDGQGRRIQVTEDGVTTTYIYSGLNVLYEENTTGTATYIYGPTGRLAKRTTINEETNTFYYHADHLGSTRLVTDHSKNIVTDAKYEPFGEATVTGEESYLYNGKELDETGLYYYGARYYDPETGRFITRDPLAGKKAVPQSLNRYSYCLNNPVKMVDPAGLVSFCTGDGEEMVCIHFTESGWFATKGQGSDTIKITDSTEMEKLMNSDDPADQAKAAYLMLLITHPEIQGDPGQVGSLNEGMSNASETSTWFDFHVTINGQEQTIHIGIDERQYIYRENGEIVYGYADFSRDKSGSLELTMRLFQAAFSSVPMLFHIVGHEGAHLLDFLTDWGTNPLYAENFSRERIAYAWNFNFSNVFVFPFTFEMPMVT